MKVPVRFAVAAAALVAACAPTPSQPQVSAPPVIGLANPSSVACVRGGGKSEVWSTPQGQIGVCLKDGRRCEEWALFRDGRCEAPPADATRNR